MDFLKVSYVSLNSALILSSIIFAIISGLLIRIALSITNHKWASTSHHTITYTLLPLTTLIITKVISNNIALSLGMIGALSIVRFRNPVKNPLELVIYFVLITIGISYSVDMKYGFLLTFSTLSILLFFHFFNKFQFVNRFNLHSISFEEGNKNYTLDIICKKNYDQLVSHPLLIQHYNDKSNKSYSYRLGSTQKEKVLEVFNIYKNFEDIISIELNF